MGATEMRRAGNLVEFKAAIDAKTDIVPVQTTWLYRNPASGSIDGVPNKLPSLA